VDVGSVGLLALWGSVVVLALATVARWLIPSKEKATIGCMAFGPPGQSIRTIAEAT
jgi:hypothetical protein